MTVAASFVLRAGPLARERIAREGLHPDSLAALGAPAGGPKFIITAALDHYLFGDWLPRRQRPLASFGSSIGAFRLVAAAHRDPVAANERLFAAYSAQRYASKPTATEVTRQVRQILQALLDPADIDHVLHHPWLQINLITTGCRGLAASEARLLQTLGFGLAFLHNLRHRDQLARSFERWIFHNRTPASARLRADAFTTHYRPLTADNLAPATLASGTIPLVMDTVRHLPDDPQGAHIDGGLVDYHMDLPLDVSADDGLLFIPHYEQRVVPGWLDKGLKRRGPRHSDRMLVLSPSPELVASLPGGKIPCRKDFNIYHGRDEARLKAWEAGLKASRIIADEFRALIDSGRVADVLKPL